MGLQRNSLPVCISLMLVKLNVPLFERREQPSPSPCPPQAGTARPPSRYTVTRQAGPHWVHSEKLLCRLPPRSFIICPWLCEVLRVPTVHTALRLSNQGTQKMGERTGNSPRFCRQKSCVICSQGHRELGNQPFSPELEKDHSGSCCRRCALFPFH